MTRNLITRAWRAARIDTDMLLAAAIGATGSVLAVVLVVELYVP
jgi:hypothetical protein